MLIIIFQVEAIAGSMYKNTEVKVKIIMGNIPLTIAQDAPQFGYPNQSSNQINLLNGQLPPNYTQPIGFNEPTSVPGFAQQVPPYGPVPFTSPYPQQSMVPAQSVTSYIQPSPYPQTQVFNQSQLPYPNTNIQQPAFNPSYQTLNSEVNPSAPTAPSF